MNARIVLMYHGLVSDEFPRTAFDAAAAPMLVAEKQFLRHLTLVSERGIKIVTPESRDGGVMLTFDDNLPCHLRTARLLAQRKIPAIFFVTTDDIDRPGRLSEDALRAIVALGHRVGSHSARHEFLDDLADPFGQLDASRRRLAQVAGSDIALVSFPGGRYNRRVLGAAKMAGFRQIFTSDPSANETLADVPSIWGRIDVKSEYDDRFFEKLVTGDAATLRGLIKKGRIKRAIRRAVGNRAYYALWRIFRKG